MATDLVIFDCDGVLIDSEIISAQMLIDELSAPVSASTSTMSRGISLAAAIRR